MVEFQAGRAGMKDPETGLEVITEPVAMRERAETWRRAGELVGVVPTMGALHAGHLSLVKKSLADSDRTVVTIFVNPTQFGPGEDLDAYPRPFAEDLACLASAGPVTVFAPSADSMYPPGFSTGVNPPRVARKLEGESRPHHFAGVATVVLKLLLATAADLAYFGQKDFQQLAVVRRMALDLNLPTRIVGCPIVRDADGLALSSRNVYLSADERAVAPILFRTLESCRSEVAEGERDTHMLMASMRQMLIDGGVTRVDYAVIADAEQLDVHDRVQFPAVALIAAYVGKTRLIDNCLLSPHAEEAETVAGGTGVESGEGAG